MVQQVRPEDISPARESSQVVLNDEWRAAIATVISQGSVLGKWIDFHGKALSCKIRYIGEEKYHVMIRRYDRASDKAWRRIQAEARMVVELTGASAALLQTGGLKGQRVRPIGWRGQRLLADVT